MSDERILKFIADGMLGKLTRWLRILGYDIEYFKVLSDDLLIERAKEGQRILLTRDLELYQRAIAKGIRALYVEGNDEVERLAIVTLYFNLNLDVDVAISRCPKCNVIIELVSKEDIAGRVPEKTFKRYNEFWKCPKCEQIYWQGSHWIRIEETLNNVKRLLSGRRAHIFMSFKS